VSAYADTSALRRLLLDDEVSDALEAFLLDQDHLATSDLTLTELHRVAGWHDIDPDVVEDVVSRFDRVPLTAALFRQAGLLPHQPGAYLRSLDALHIVAALDTSQSAFVTYDSRQATAAAAVGLRVVAPGRRPDWYRAPADG
jgi:predicted nucleic acid-binding protein